MADLRQRVQIEATLKDRGASRGLDNIRSKSESAFGERGGIAFHAGKARVALGVFGTAIAAAALGVQRMVAEVARQNDEIAKLSTRLGASTEALSQLRFVAERSGVSFETLTMGLQRMTRRIAEAASGTGEARDALKELGLSAQELNRQRPEDQFKRIADQIARVGNQGDRVRLAMRLFDSEGVALVQTMEQGAAGIERLQQQADRMGLTVTEQIAKQAEAYEDAVTNLSSAFDGLSSTLADDVMPSMTSAANAVAGILSGLNKALENSRGIAGAGLGFQDGPRPFAPGTATFRRGADGGFFRVRQGGLFTPGSNFSTLNQSADTTLDDLGVTTVTSTATTRSRALSNSTRAFSKAGESGAKAYLDTIQTTVEKDQPLVDETFADAGDFAAFAFLGEKGETKQGLKVALAAGLTDYVLEGDLKNAAGTFGYTLAGGMIVRASDRLADGIINKLGDLTGGFREDLVAAGQGIGKTMLSGFDNVNFAGKFGIDGDIGGGIGRELAGTFSDAVMGGAFGLGIGTLIGDEITAKAAGIGGALGGALAGPVGSVIGSITAALGSNIPVLGDAIDNLFGITDNKEAQSFLTDVRAFGGLVGYFERIGGVEGIRGSRAAEFVNNNQVQNAIRDLTRVEFGTTREQAEDFVDFLQSVAVNNQAVARGDDAPVRNAGFRALLSSPRSSQSEISNVLSAIGFDPASVFFGSASSLGGGGTGTISIGTDDSGNPTGPVAPAGKPVGPAPRPRLSLSTGLDAFAAGGSFLSSYLDSLGAPKGTAQGNNILNFLASGGSDQGARQYLSGFFDIVAAKGFHGTLTQPTAILAGEAGPERVDITPGGSDYVGGGRGGGGVANHFSITINALDANSVDAAAERLVERVRQGLLDVSERGLPVVYGSGVVNPPRV